MGKFLFSLFVLFTSFITSQNKIQGFISPNINTDWLILYRIEGTKQEFVNNTTIKKDSIVINGIKQFVGSFSFQLPKNSKPGTYRATYDLENGGFLDFLYNKGDVEFIFNPEYPKLSVAFTKSKENKLYKNYLESITKAQDKIDSIQVAYLKDSTLNLNEEYLRSLNEFNKLQNQFEESSKNMLAFDFVKANPRVNSEILLNSPKEYLNKIKNTFFNKLDFSNSNLVNSSFLTNRVLDYIFYINFTDDENSQQALYKKSIDTVLSKIDSKNYKKEIIEFLINQFEEQKNIEIIDYLFDKHYNNLPKELQDLKFKKDKKALFAAEIGRTAPDFSWEEKGKKYKLSTLNEAKKYVLVFWSSTCFHCLRDIPKLHSFMLSQPNIKVISFALESDSFVWEEYSRTKLNGWHNVLGLNKWENKIARTYQINSTPSFFVLDENKKIIAKPEELKDLKEYLKM